MNITDISGIGEATAQRMKTHGIDSVEAVAQASIEQLVAVPGIGPDRAAALRQSAIRLLPEAAVSQETGTIPGAEETVAAAGAEETVAAAGDEEAVVAAGDEEADDTPRPAGAEAKRRKDRNKGKGGQKKKKDKKEKKKRRKGKDKKEKRDKQPKGKKGDKGRKKRKKGKDKRK